jgi:small subunit ribosomal protein S6
MIYETCALLRAETSEAAIKNFIAVVEETITTRGGSVLIKEDWGQRKLAQPTSRGVDRGHFIFFMYKGPVDINAELSRRYGINEDMIKFLIVKLGEEHKEKSFLNAHVNPFNEGDPDQNPRDLDKEKRMFAKRQSCWFTANKTQASWKNPSTYCWIVSDFGKIAPGRVNGITRKHQTLATAAIKQARIIGLLAHHSDRIAH